MGDGEKPWFNIYIPGNKNYTQVKTVNVQGPPPPGMKEPVSSEARSKMAEYQFSIHGGMIAGLGMLKPCDKMGRILSSPDGTFCNDDQACVTALPADFAKDTGKFCWHLFQPECKRVECPPPPFCQPVAPVKGKDGRWYRPPENCPPLKPCPKQPPCEKPYWRNECKLNAGMPWCVPADVLKQYRGPIEISCGATGNTLRQTKGSPDQCWWLNKYKPEADLQRLPGKIRRDAWPASGWFVQHDPEALSSKQAETFIQTGRLIPKEDPDLNSEFLEKKPRKVQELRSA